MTQKLNQTIRNKVFLIGLILLSVLIFSGMIVYAVNPILGSIQIALGVGGGFCWGLSEWLKRQIITRPLRQLADAAQNLADHDTVKLVDSLSTLAQGNLMAHALFEAQPPLSLTSTSEVNRLMEAFNKITIHLQESAREFNNVTDEPCQRLCFVGADAYTQGRVCGETMGQLLNNQGEIAITMGSFSHITYMTRRAGFEMVLREKYPGIHVVEVAESKGNPEGGYQVTTELLKRHPNLAGIYVSEGGSPPGTCKAIVEAHAAGKIKIVTHDQLDANMHYLTQGVITAIISQDPFTQGHDCRIPLPKDMTLLFTFSIILYQGGVLQHLD